MLEDWRQEEKGMTEDEMVGWHHQLNGHEFEKTPGVGDGQGSLVCCSPWGLKESDTTEDWTELNLPLSTLLTALPCHCSSQASHAPISVCLLQVPSIWNVLLTSRKYPTVLRSLLKCHLMQTFQVLLKYSPFTYFIEFIIMWHYIIYLHVHLFYWLYPP